MVEGLFRGSCWDWAQFTRGGAIETVAGWISVQALMLPYEAVRGSGLMHVLPYCRDAGVPYNWLQSIPTACKEHGQNTANIPLLRAQPTSLP